MPGQHERIEALKAQALRVELDYAWSQFHAAMNEYAILRETIENLHETIAMLREEIEQLRGSESKED